MGLFPAAVRHLFYYYRARGNFHLPLPFQGMKNNEEDIMHAPEGMARWSQRAELYSGSNTTDLLITNVKLTFLGSF